MQRRGRPRPPARRVSAAGLGVEHGAALVDQWSAAAADFDWSIVDDACVDDLRLVEWMEKNSRWPLGEKERTPISAPYVVAM